MEKPIVADNKPKMADLEADKNYAWCACGKSSNQPFCDIITNIHYVKSEIRLQK